MKQLEKYELKGKKIFSIEKGKSFYYGTFGEDDEAKEILQNVDIANTQIIEGKDYAIINFDSKILQPYVSYILNNISTSRELAGINYMTYILYFIVFLILLLFVFVLMTKSVQNEILQHQLSINNIFEKKAKEIKQKKPVQQKFEKDFFEKQEKPNINGSGEKGEFNL